MKLDIKKIILCAVLSVSSFFCVAQDKTKPLWGDTSAFLNRQTELSLHLIDSVLNTNLPVEGEQLVRKLALYNMDAILHERKYDKSPALLQFADQRIKAALEDMKRPVKKGMKIYKLYNHGFIVRTKSVTLAFDLFRGKGLINDSLMQAIANQADILFISHIHGDHADRQVAEMFLKAGKPVWAPTNVWENDKAIRHIRPETTITEQVQLKNNTVAVQVLPGHQGNLMNNIYWVTTPEGLSVAQTGDQSQKKDMEWIAKIKDQPGKLDVLLVNCWTYDLPAFVNGFNPKLVITGHENEMGHSIDHREPYWLSFLKLKKISKPYVLMTWGEHYLYKQ